MTQSVRIPDPVHEKAEEIKDIHDYASARGLGPLALQAMMGWADISTARNYVAQSSENTQRQLHQIHSR